MIKQFNKNNYQTPKIEIPITNQGAFQAGQSVQPVAKSIGQGLTNVATLGGIIPNAIGTTVDFFKGLFR